MAIVIIDYGLGNLGSVKNAMDRLGVNVIVSNSVKKIEAAAGLILPGVGSANQGMKNLRKRGLDKIIITQAKRGKALLGICLGMQLLFSESEEGDTKCLNLIEGKVNKFNNKLKVPQIGWNQLRIENSELRIKNLFTNIKNKTFFYFNHSFYCNPKNSSLVTGLTDYGINFCSAVKKNNIFGVQFHPEKSGENGLQLFKNFSNLSLS